MNSLKNPIFLLGCHKSGTSLLRSLLDGHPELIVFPKETHFFQYGGYGTLYPIRRSWPNKKNNEEFIESLAEGVINENDSKDPYSDNPGFKGYNVDRFKKALTQMPLETASSRMNSYFKALYYSLTGLDLPNSKRIVEKSVESAEHASWLRMLFPDCKFIHIVRNPYATFSSLVRSKIRSGRYPQIRPLTESVLNSTFYLFQNRQILDEYTVIRYEDLITEPDKIMKKLAMYLGIEFDPVLLEPTSNGVPWSGNSSSDIKFSGISDSTLENWKNCINSLEIKLVNRFLMSLITEFSYKKIENRGKWFMPVKGETLKVYLRNRIFLYLS